MCTHPPNMLDLLSKDGSKDGRFLLRLREETPESFILSVTFKGRQTHHLVTRNDEGQVLINKRQYTATKQTNLWAVLKELHSPPAVKGGWPVPLLEAPVTGGDIVPMSTIISMVEQPSTLSQPSTQQQEQQQQLQQQLQQEPAQAAPAEEEAQPDEPVPSQPATTSNSTPTAIAVVTQSPPATATEQSLPQHATGSDEIPIAAPTQVAVEEQQVQAPQVLASNGMQAPVTSTDTAAAAAAAGTLQHQQPQQQQPQQQEAEAETRPAEANKSGLSQQNLRLHQDQVDMEEEAKEAQALAYERLARMQAQYAMGDNEQTQPEPPQDHQPEHISHHSQYDQAAQVARDRAQQAYADVSNKKVCFNGYT